MKKAIATKRPAPLRIPDRVKAGLIELSELSIDEVNELAALLEKAPPTLNREILIGNLALEWYSVEQETAESVLGAVLELYHGVLLTGLPVPEFVESIAATLNYKATKQKQKQFKETLVRLLSFESIEIAIKALGVLTDSVNPFHSGRSLAEILPVFKDNPSDSPVAAMVVHRLKIEYHDGSEIKEFHLTLDTEDVKKLRDVLERSIAKAQTLKDSFQDEKLQWLDFDS